MRALWRFLQDTAHPQAEPLHFPTPTIEGLEPWCILAGTGHRYAKFHLLLNVLLGDPFFTDTSFDQVKDASPDDVAFFVMDKITLRKMENALMKILLLGADAAVDAGLLEIGCSTMLQPYVCWTWWVFKNTAATAAGFVQYRPVTANLAFASTLEVAEDPRQATQTQVQSPDRKQSTGPTSPQAPHKHLAMIDLVWFRCMFDHLRVILSGGFVTDAYADVATGHLALRPKMSTQEVRTQPTAADPFADLKTAFEPQREKLKTFNLKQIVTWSTMGTPSGQPLDYCRCTWGEYL